LGETKSPLIVTSDRSGQCGAETGRSELCALFSWRRSQCHTIQNSPLL